MLSMAHPDIVARLLPAPTSAGRTERGGGAVQRRQGRCRRWGMGRGAVPGRVCQNQGRAHKSLRRVHATPKWACGWGRRRGSRGVRGGRGVHARQSERVSLMPGWRVGGAGAGGTRAGAGRAAGRIQGRWREGWARADVGLGAATSGLRKAVGRGAGVPLRQEVVKPRGRERERSGVRGQCLWWAVGWRGWQKKTWRCCERWWALTEGAGGTWRPWGRRARAREGGDLRHVPSSSPQATVLLCQAHYGDLVIDGPHCWGW